MTGALSHKRFRCTTCNRSFATQKDKSHHWRDKHAVYLKLSAKDRPSNLGPVPCGIGNCGQSFANEWNAIQHRSAVHDVWPKSTALT